MHRDVVGDCVIFGHGQGVRREVVTTCEPHTNAIPELDVAAIRTDDEAWFSLWSVWDKSVELGGHGERVGLFRTAEDVVRRRARQSLASDSL